MARSDFSGWISALNLTGGALFTAVFCVMASGFGHVANETLRLQSAARAQAAANGAPQLRAAAGSNATERWLAQQRQLQQRSRAAATVPVAGIRS